MEDIVVYIDRNIDMWKCRGLFVFVFVNVCVFSLKKSNAEILSPIWDLKVRTWEDKSQESRPYELWVGLIPS